MRCMLDGHLLANGVCDDTDEFSRELHVVHIDTCKRLLVHTSRGNTSIGVYASKVRTRV